MPPATGADPATAPRWNGLHVLGRGFSRLCALDPGREDCCLKFELAQPGRKPVGLRRRLQRLAARHWPRFGDNALELRAWQYLQRRLGDDAALRFAASEGIVATPWGTALRARIVRDGGGIARNLHYHMDNGTHTAEALCAAVDDFVRFLQDHRIPLFDLNAGNFVVVAGVHGPRLVCIDAKSVFASREILPLSRHVPFLLRRKIARRAGRLRRLIHEAASASAALAPSARDH